MTNIYTGTINPNGYETLSSLTGVEFVEDVKYSIQLLNPAYVREGTVGKGFLINSYDPIYYIANATLYIAPMNDSRTAITINIADESAEE